MYRAVFSGMLAAGDPSRQYASLLELNNRLLHAQEGGISVKRLIDPVLHVLYSTKDNSLSALGVRALINMLDIDPSAAFQLSTSGAPVLLTTLLENSTDPDVMEHSIKWCVGMQ